MKYRFVREPTEEERKELVRMTQQEIGRVAMRAQMILLSAQGYKVPKIVEIHDTSNVTVYKWLDRFDAEGPAGLYDRPRSGRPTKADAEVEAALKEALSEPPTEQGYTFTIWTVPLLKKYVEKEVGVQMCEETIRSNLHKMGFRWKRPRWEAAREDPQAKELMNTIGRAIWNASPETVIFVQDETKFTTLPPLRRMWMPEGKQVRIPTPEQNGKCYSYGALDIESGQWFSQFSENANSDVTVNYLEGLLAAHPNRPILLIWDQASYHTSHKVQNWIEDCDRLTTLLLPKYSPELNPVEHIWRVVKQRVSANLTREIEVIQESHDAFFEEQSPQSLLEMASLAL